MARGVSGIGIAVATVGSVLLYAGFRNVTPLAALKAVTSGKLAPLASTVPVGTVLTPETEHGGKGGDKGGGGTATKETLVAFGRGAQQGGYRVSEHSQFGGVHPVHVPNSQHYSDKALDINHGAGASTNEQSHLAKLVPLAHAAGLDTIFMGKFEGAHGGSSPASGHYDHLHVQIPR